MKNAATVSQPKNDADYEAEVDYYLGKASLLQQSMDADRAEIKVMQEETRAILNNIMAMLGTD